MELLTPQQYVEIMKTFYLNNYDNCLFNYEYAEKITLQCYNSYYGSLSGHVGKLFAPESEQFGLQNMFNMHTDKDDLKN